MVSPQKIEEVKNLAEKATHSKTIGLVNISGIPSKQFQQMRKNLRGKADLRIGRNTILKRSLEKANLKEISEKVEGATGLVSTELTPFQLNKLLKDNKSSAPAKPGDPAPHDIVIPAGDTSLPPGPILGELQKVGIKAQIKSGKIVVMQDSLVVRGGESISKDLAIILPRFGIEPREISLNMKIAYDASGTIYSQDVLSIDQDSLLSDITSARKNTFNLAFTLKFFTSETLPLFLQDAHTNAFNVALTAEILTKETAPHMLQKAHSQASSLSPLIPKPKVKEEKPKEEPKEEIKEAPKEEVKKPEAPKPEPEKLKEAPKAAEKPVKEEKKPKAEKPSAAPKEAKSKKKPAKKK